MTSSKALRVICCAAVIACAFVPALQARTCNGNADVNGYYGFAGERRLFWTSSTTAPGSATLTGVPVTDLVASAAGVTPFGVVGNIQADGNGNLLAATTAGGSNVPVGTYTVNSDCTIMVTLNNTTTTTESNGTTTTTITATATFEGAVLPNADQIDLVETGAASGTVLTLRRTVQINACTNASLSGTYLFLGSGSNFSAATSTTGSFDNGSLTPFQILARTTADGNGNFYVDSPGASSPLTSRQVTGTYTVNSDCTGVATLSSSGTSGGTAQSINFILVNLPSRCTVFGRVNANFPPEIFFVSSTPNVIGSGIATPQ